MEEACISELTGGAIDMVTLYWGSWLVSYISLPSLGVLEFKCWFLSWESMLDKQEEGLLLIGTGNTTVSAVIRKAPMEKGFVCMSMKCLYTILE